MPNASPATAPSPSPAPSPAPHKQSSPGKDNASLLSRLLSSLPSSPKSLASIGLAIGGACYLFQSKEAFIRFMSNDKLQPVGGTAVVRGAKQAGQPLREPPSPSFLKKAFFALCTIWFFAETCVVAIWGFSLQLPLWLASFVLDPRRLYVGRLFRLTGILAVKFNPLWDFRVMGTLPESIRKNGPGKTVVVSNHESLTDPFLISHLPWEMKWLSKRSNFRIPFAGWSMALAGDIPLDRGNKDSAKGAMGRCAKYLQQGVPVCIFPEGTRSKTDELLPFKDGAFRLAIDQGADILPIAVSGTGRAMRKHSRIIYPSIAYVTVGTPIKTTGMTLDDVESLKQQAREQIIELRASLHEQSAL